MLFSVIDSILKKKLKITIVLSIHISCSLSFIEAISPSMLQEAEILALWLSSLGYAEYLAAFLTQGYDLSTIARMTPEDLIALGITHPIHRKFLISEIHRWRINDRWPTLVPSGKLRLFLLVIFELLSVKIALFNLIRSNMCCKRHVE